MRDAPGMRSSIGTASTYKCRRHHDAKDGSKSKHQNSPRCCTAGRDGDPGGGQEDCTGFGCPMETEIAWMTSADSEAIESGAKMPGLAAKAIALKLKPSKEVTLPVKSGRKKQAIGAGQLFRMVRDRQPAQRRPVSSLALASRAGSTRLRKESWLQSHGFHRKDRPAKPCARASAMSLALGRSRVQIAGAPAETVKVTIREAN